MHPAAMPPLILIPAKHATTTAAMPERMRWVYWPGHMGVFAKLTDRRNSGAGGVNDYIILERGFY